MGVVACRNSCISCQAMPLIKPKGGRVLCHLDAGPPLVSNGVLGQGPFSLHAKISAILFHSRNFDRPNPPNEIFRSNSPQGIVLLSFALAIILFTFG